MARSFDLYPGVVFEAPDDVIDRLWLRRGENDELIYRVADEADVLDANGHSDSWVRCWRYAPNPGLRAEFWRSG